DLLQLACNDRIDCVRQTRTEIVRGIQHVYRVHLTISSRVHEIPRLSCRRDQAIRRRQAAWLLRHGEAAKKEKLVAENRTANAAAKLIQNERRLLDTKRIIAPRIRVERGVAMVLIDPAVKAVAAAAGDEVELRARLTETRVHVQRIGLHRHL